MTRDAVEVTEEMIVGGTSNKNSLLLQIVRLGEEECAIYFDS